MCSKRGQVFRPKTSSSNEQLRSAIPTTPIDRVLLHQREYQGEQRRAKERNRWTSSLSIASKTRQRPHWWTQNARRLEGSMARARQHSVPFALEAVAGKVRVSSRCSGKAPGDVPIGAAASELPRDTLDDIVCNTRRMPQQRPSERGDEAYSCCWSSGRKERQSCL